MSLDAVKAILSSPVEAIGSGSRNPLHRKVNRFWPVGIAMAAVLFSANAMAHPGYAQETAPAATIQTTVQDEAAPVAQGDLTAPVVDMEAMTVNPDPEEVGRFQVYYQKLGAFESRTGETKERFMARVGTFLAYYTNNTGWEACGMVQEADNGDGWAVRLITNGSQIGCAQIKFDTPGYTNTNESIHSHPGEGSLRVSLQDQRIRGDVGCGTYVRVQPYDFSPQDYKVGAGYLVVPAGMFSGPKLLYQNGVGTSQHVDTLSRTEVAQPDTPVFGETLADRRAELVAMNEVVSEKVTVGIKTCKTF